MRWLLVSALTLALAGGALAADVASAELNLKRVRRLVEEGAASQAALKAAEDQLRDARNEAVLKKTLYAGDVAAEEAPEMLRAAGELRERASEALAGQEKLVAAGVAPEPSLTRLREDRAAAERQWELAQSRAKLIEELAEMARREAQLHEEARAALAIASEGKGTLTDRDFARVESAFQRQFAHPLPVSARGETAIHRSLGFDHRERFDVALNPDQEEGRWLIGLLNRLSVPYVAFRRAVAGKATGAHIHVGLPSPRL